MRKFTCLLTTSVLAGAYEGWEINPERFDVFEAGVTDSECPYRPNEGYSLFCCKADDETFHSDHCTDLHVKRLVTAHSFMVAKGTDFVEQARNFEVAPLFTKVEEVRGDEAYEEMDLYHIRGLKRDRVKIQSIEDKIALKKLAQEVNMPTTDLYYSAHKDTWDETDFQKNLKELCSKKVDGFIIKPTHMSYSKGIKVVRDWQASCENEASLEERLKSLTNFTYKEALLPDAIHTVENEHLQGMPHGIVVEELFSSGGASTKPIEVKVQVLFGKVYDMWFMGMDHRGCRVRGGTWHVFGDKTGWNLNGLIGEKEDAASTLFMEKFFDNVTHFSEAFAKHVGADYTRVDFFLRMIGNDPTFKLNEVETVTGTWYEYGRQGLGEAWRDGYVVGKKDEWVKHASEEKWTQLMANVKKDRAILWGSDDGSDEQPAGETGIENALMMACLVLLLISMSAGVLLVREKNLNAELKAPRPSARETELSAA